MLKTMGALTELEVEQHSAPLSISPFMSKMAQVA